MFVRRILSASCYEAAYLVLFIRTTRKQGVVFFGRMAVLFYFHSIDFECEPCCRRFNTKTKSPEGLCFICLFLSGEYRVRSVCTLWLFS